MKKFVGVTYAIDREGSRDEERPERVWYFDTLGELLDWKEEMEETIGPADGNCWSMSIGDEV